MAGYNGFSMSNNAVEAYNDGEMPLSKWTKSAILEAVKELELTNFSMDNFKKLQASELKRVALTKSSWHHTSSHYNKTDFYEIDIASLEKLTNQEINNIITQRGTLTTVAPKVEKWECRYLVWSGSRKHPKATEVDRKSTRLNSSH